jgi:Cu(I)/Ag(I) efflux system membrane protein CusA/SilA
MVAIIRRYHRWLMLFVGLQFLVWSFSGLYMVLVDIHSIHGEGLVNAKQPVLAPWTEGYQNTLKSTSQSMQQQIRPSISTDINDVLSEYPNASNISLGWLGNKPVYRLTSGVAIVIDATTGDILKSISKDLATTIALSSLGESREIKNVELITDNPPSEIGFRSLPLWRVDFVGMNSPTLYINHTTGEIVTVRQNTWRIFDLLWRLHIMDYYEGEDINNWLLNVFTISGVLAAFSGLILLWFRLFKNNPTEHPA